MKSNKYKILTLIYCMSFLFANAQQEQQKDSLKNIKTENIKFKFKQLIIPTVLIGYGVIGIESDGLKFINSGIKEEVNENIDKKITIDDYINTFRKRQLNLHSNMACKKTIAFAFDWLIKCHQKTTFILVNIFTLNIHTHTFLVCPCRRILTSKTTHF